MKLVKPIVLLSCAVALCFSLPLMTAAATTLTVVVDGLDKPRGLAFGPEGALYIAQAGRGGDGACGPGPEGIRCYGETGAISRYDPRRGNVTDVVTGLPSLATEDGQMFAIGPNDFRCTGAATCIHDRLWRGSHAARGRSSGLTARSWPTSDGQLRMAAGGCSSHRASPKPTTTRRGTKSTRTPTAFSRWQAGRSWPTPGRTPCSRFATTAPRSLATFADRLVDAPPFLGLPPDTKIPMDTVPTSVALGPDGNYYVGQLTGFPFPVDAATSTACLRREAPRKSSRAGSHTSST